MLQRFSLLFFNLFCLSLSLRGAPLLPDGLYARIETPRGVMLAELFYKQVPLTVCNFVGLAEGRLGPKPGTPYYDGLSFHRVVSGFVIQGGDPLATGEGGPGYEFPDEFAPRLRHDRPGILSMANGGPDTNGSQFFITLADTSRLNYLHSVFGCLVDGLEIPARIQKSDTMKVTILRQGALARAFSCDQSAFDALRSHARRFQGDPEPGPKSAFADPSGLLPSDVPRARNFNIKLSNFLRSSGCPLIVNLLPTAPLCFSSASPSALPAALQQLALEHGISTQGAFVLYVHDSASWHLFAPTLSPDSLARLRASAAARAEKNLFQARTLLPPGLSLTPAQTLKSQVDAWLDELIFALEPSPPSAFPPTP